MLQLNLKILIVIVLPLVLEAKIAARLPLGDNVDGGELSFYTTPDTNAPLERVRIDQDGNVGIGTSVPDYELDVIGNVGVGSTLFFVNNSGQVTKIDSTSNASLF